MVSQVREVDPGHGLGHGEVVPRDIREEEEVRVIPGDLHHHLLRHRRRGEVDRSLAISRMTVIKGGM